MRAHLKGGNQRPSREIAPQRVFGLPVGVFALGGGGRLLRLFRFVRPRGSIGALALDPDLALNLEARAARAEHA